MNSLSHALVDLTVFSMVDPNVPVCCGVQDKKDFLREAETMLMLDHDNLVRSPAGP